MQVLDDRQRARAGDHPVGARLHRRAGVGVDDHLAVGMRVAERGELVGRAAEVERAGGVEIGHQHALVRRQDLRGLAHEAHAGDDQRARRVVAAEARHLQRIGDAAAGLLARGPAGRRRRSSARPSPRRAPSARARSRSFSSSRRRERQRHRAPWPRRARHNSRRWHRRACSRRELGSCAMAACERRPGSPWARMVAQGFCPFRAGAFPPAGS